MTPLTTPRRGREPKKNVVAPSNSESQNELLSNSKNNSSSALQNEKKNAEEDLELEKVRFRMRQANGKILRQMLAVWLF